MQLKLSICMILELQVILLFRVGIKTAFAITISAKTNLKTLRTVNYFRVVGFRSDFWRSISSTSALVLPQVGGFSM